MSMSQQSPINLANQIWTDFGQDALKIQWKKSAHGTIKKDEHGVQVIFGADQRQLITLDRKLFHLVGFHFHHPSEHWVSGKQQILELHVVHQNIDDGTRAVLGIFIDVGSAGKGAVVPGLVPHFKAFASAEGDHLAYLVSTNPLDWLPADTAHYYRYEGSLTTPDYDENVSWVVFKEPLRLPKDEVNDLIRIFQHPARLPQALNRRFILANF